MTDLELARHANDRALTIRQAALSRAQILERLASLREPISPSQALLPLLAVVISCAVGSDTTAEAGELPLLADSPIPISVPRTEGFVAADADLPKPRRGGEEIAELLIRQIAGRDTIGSFERISWMRGEAVADVDPQIDLEKGPGWLVIADGFFPVRGPVGSGTAIGRRGYYWISGDTGEILTRGVFPADHIYIPPTHPAPERTELRMLGDSTPSNPQ